MTQLPIHRRSVFAPLAGGLLTACLSPSQTSHASYRLQARPQPPATPCPPGLHPLGLRKTRDALLYVPESAKSDQPAPLLVYLHGAGGAEQQGIKRLSSFADELGFLLLSPASVDSTWDAIQNGYGPDVQHINQALTRAFALRAIHLDRIALSGFSDGASYALGLGVSNGDLFTSLLSYSPGFIPSGGRQTGKPRIFISHGTNDSVLPIASCSRVLVPKLKKAGYDVTYREFDGPHTVPRDITTQSLRWFLA